MLGKKIKTFLKVQHEQNKHCGLYFPYFIEIFKPNVSFLSDLIIWKPKFISWFLGGEERGIRSIFSDLEKLFKKPFYTASLLN